MFDLFKKKGLILIPAIISLSLVLSSLLSTASANPGSQMYSGTIMHYDGSTWSEMDSGTPGWLKGVWGSSSSDVFAVGSMVGYYRTDTIIHYDGANWTPMLDSNTAWRLYDVWGSSSSDVYAVGDDGTILHYDGSTWSEMESGTSKNLHGIWGSSDSNVFAVGGNEELTEGIILHYGE